MRPRVCGFFHEKAAEVESQPDGSETYWMLTHGQRELVWRCALVCLFWRLLSTSGALAVLSPERFENVCAFFKERLSS